MTIKDRLEMLEEKIDAVESMFLDIEDEIFARLQTLDIRICRMESQMAMDEEDLDWIFEKVCKKEDGPEIATEGYNWLGETEVELPDITNCDIYKDCEKCPEFDICFDELVPEEVKECPDDCDEDCECCECDEEECDECEVYHRDQERQCSPECEEDCTTCYWEEGAAYDEMEAYMDSLRFKGL